MKRSLAGLIAFIIILFPLSANALRCGSNIVVEGDSEYRVLSICGEPSYKETYYRSEESYNPYGPYTVSNLVQYDKWTYNFGSTQLLTLVTFRNGELYRIDTNGYGFPEQPH